MKSKSPTQSFIVLLLLLITGFGGYFLGKHEVEISWSNYKPSITATDVSAPQNTAQTIDFKLFWDVFNRLQAQYIDKNTLDTKKMYYGAIMGMVQAVGDPYTLFLPPDQNKETKEQLAGHFEGIGAQLGVQDKKTVVIAPLDGSPAEKAGVKAGDWIIKVDDKDALNWTLQQTVDKIRGPKGTSVKLTLVHQNQDKPVDIMVVRDTIVIKSVTWSPKEKNGKKVAYIKLSQFGERTNNEWDQAISEIMNYKNANSANFKGVILDVRNNPGGFLTDAVSIGSEFIASGPVVLQEDAKGNRQSYDVNRAGKLLNIPVDVLINKGSASAAEIVSGALRDRRGVKLIGEKSFGKGTIQEAIDLPEGAGIHITTHKWLTPNGTWVNKTQGLQPDIEVKLDDTKQGSISGTTTTQTDAQLDKAIEELY